MAISISLRIAVYISCSLTHFINISLNLDSNQRRQLVMVHVMRDKQTVRLINNAPLLMGATFNDVKGGMITLALQAG
jgi:hypothetical protein